MFSQWTIRILESLMGREIPALCGKYERTIRRLKSGDTKTPRVAERTLMVEMMAEMLRAFPKAGRPDQKQAEQELDRWLAAGGVKCGLVETFVANYVPDFPMRAALVELAVQMDLLSAQVAQPVAAQDISAVQALLRDSQFLSQIYWESSMDGTDLRRLLAEATSWEGVLVILVNLQFNCILSFVSLCDVLFVSTTCPDHEPIPIFLAVAPGLKNGLSATDHPSCKGLQYTSTKNMTTVRDFIDFPIGKFLDICARRKRRLDGGHATQPLKLKEMAALFSQDPNHQDTKKLDQYKSGRDKVTVHTLRLLGIDDGFCAMLLAVTHLWNLWLVRGKPRSVSYSVIICDEAYRRFWLHHRENLKAKGYNLGGGDGPWPEEFLRMTDLHARKSSSSTVTY